MMRDSSNRRPVAFSSETAANLSRREWLAAFGGVCLAGTQGFVSHSSAVAQEKPAPATRRPKKKVAGVVTEYRHNSHADVICSRLIQTYTLDGKGGEPGMELVSLYTDQVPANDTSRKLAQQYKFALHENVAGALTLGTGKLAVEGILLVAEHGTYPESPTGQHMYPKRRLFDECIKVFRQSDRVVPMFIDKHLSDNWKDAKSIYDTARDMKIPLMAGSSLPGLWRKPAADVERGRVLKEIFAISYHRLDAYGFHAVEMVQCLAENRKGGETGIRRVQCLVDEAVWKAGEEGVYDKTLFAEVLKHATSFIGRKDRTLQQNVPHPVLFIIDYNDGLRACILTLDGAYHEWTVSWRYGDGAKEVVTTTFDTHEARPFMHFALLVDKIDQMMHSGQPTYPVERTLLTSGVLDALLISKKEGGKAWSPAYLADIRYQPTLRWQPPPPPTESRPIEAQ